MAKTRWVNVSFPAGGHQENYKGFDIIEVEVYYSNTGQTATEFGVFGHGMRIFGHLPSVADAKSYVDALLNAGINP